MPIQNHWYQQTAKEAIQAHDSSLEHGLSHDEAKARVTKFGPNILEDFKRKSALRIFVSQFSNLLVVVLIFAALISVFIGEPQDSFVIGAIILLNAMIGFFQEYRAEKTMETLKKLTTPLAKVRRMGKIHIISSHELVPGDIVLLEAGNIVPADLRVLESFQLEVDESLLTGESLPVSKLHHVIDEQNIALADQKNMAFKGTRVTKGRAHGLVVNTGSATELGKIGKLFQTEVEVETPLQRRIGDFAKKLAFVVLLICALIYLIGIQQGEEPWNMLMTALSLAVAAIPEALPAVVAIALALGARYMASKNALVRKLPAVETLGSVTCICSDKTGTLTENKMKAVQFYIDNSFHTSIPRPLSNDSNVDLLIKALLLNNDSIEKSPGEWEGDPTEMALIFAALPLCSSRKNLELEYPRIAEAAFSSERGMMSTLHQAGDRKILFCKGAAERVLSICKNVDVTAMNVVGENMGQQGLRVLAIGYRQVGPDEPLGTIEDSEKDLTLLGFVGLMDPPRAEALSSIQLCRSAGIRPMMITGDHPATALSIARHLQIATPERPRVLTGKELLSMDDAELIKHIEEVSVFARVAPEQKIRIVKALQANNEVVAMTGDGVNDAPALRRADVGISMGKSGTDVAREASHIILLDDNFATIVSAVREGRRIYDNIRKFIKFALSGNSGEVWTLFTAPLVGLPIPFLPIHILWINLVTDGLPGLALSLEPEEKNTMTRPPRKPTESLFAEGLWQHCLWAGLLTAITTLVVLAWAYHTGRTHWQSIAFTVLTFTQMGHVLAIRNKTESFFSTKFSSNIYLLVAVIGTCLLQIAVLYTPIFNKLLKTEPLTLEELLICMAASSTVFLAVEFEKWLRRRRLKN